MFLYIYIYKMCESIRYAVDMSTYNTSACLLFKMSTKSHAACRNNHHINFIVEKGVAITTQH